MTNKARVNTTIPGPKSKAIFDLEQHYIAPGVQTIATLSQLALEKGEGCVVEDVDGNRYIDFFAGVAVASLGYNHPKYVKAIQQQVAKIHVGSFVTQVRADLSKLLADNAVADLRRTQYYSGGAEAVGPRPAGEIVHEEDRGDRFGAGPRQDARRDRPDREGLHQPTASLRRLYAPYANCRRCPLNHTFPDCKWPASIYGMIRSRQRRRR